MTQRLAWLAVLTLGALAAGSQAQVPQATDTGPKKIFTRVPQFRLPFNLDDADRAKLRSVVLYVKAGDEPWMPKETVDPAQAFFTYRAAHDGEFWFTIVVVGKGGNSTPADVTRQPPGLIVVVDTKPPELEVKATPNESVGPWLRCEVSQANPDPASVRMEYQRPDGSWRPLAPLPESANLFRFPGSQEWPGEREWNGKVRAHAADKAGNTTTREFTFKPSAIAPSAVQTGHIENRVEKPNALPPFLAESSSRPLHPTPSTNGIERVAHAVSRQFVNSTHISLDYRVEQLGPSGVGKVEVWITRDNGQIWSRLCEDPHRRSPVECELPGEGLYGVSLVVSNGNGVGDPVPARGDAPDVWIEVDTTRPTANLLAVRPGTGADAGCLVFSYEAHDKNLGAAPIHLFYATRRDGPWLPVVRGAANDGSYRWTAPRDAGPEFYFRLEVIDLAGNVARSDLAERVLVDVSRPRAKVVGVSASGVRAAPPDGN